MPYTLSDIAFVTGQFVNLERYAEEFESLLHFAQMQLFNGYIDRVDEDGFDKTALDPFVVNMGSDYQTMPLVVASSGLAPIPDDFAKHISFTFHYNGQQVMVEKVDEDEFNFRKRHKIETPTREYPIASYLGDYIKFLPKNLQYVNYSYYKIPPTVVYATKQENGMTVYDSTNSTELLWYDQDKIEVIKILLQGLGIIVSTNQIKEKIESR